MPTVRTSFLQAAIEQESLMMRSKKEIKIKGKKEYLRICLMFMLGIQAKSGLDIYQRQAARGCRE
jgi:hypothetical protein